MAKRDSSEFINLTLTEFLMVIIFMLIILLIYTFKQNEPVPSEAELTPQEMVQLEKDATELLETLFHEDASQDDEKPILQLTDKLMDAIAAPEVRQYHKERTLPGVWDTLVEQKIQVASLQRELQELTETLNKNNDKKTVIELKKQKKRLEKVLEQVREDLNKYDPLKKKFSAKNEEELVQEVNNLIGQYKELVIRAKKKGVGSPLCWADVGGEKVFIFHITITEKGTFIVKPIFPKEKEAAIRAIGYRYYASTVTLSENAFKQQMTKFWLYGQKKDNCRFFVRVKDETRTKTRWKNGLRMVENYFYKLEI